MFKNYFKTAFRSLLKNRTSSIINIGGLAIGMAVAILIGLWMYDELAFNKDFKNYDRIAQVMQNVTNNGEVQTWQSIPYPLAEELRKNYGADFKQVCLSSDGGDHLIALNDKRIKQSGTFFEKGALQMLNPKMLQGNYNSLNDPASVVLSASAAKALFGDKNPINNVLKIDDLPPVKVTGVYQDFAANTTFARFKFISSWEFLYANTSWVNSMDDPWRPNSFSLYVQLADNADINIVSAKIKDAKLKRVNAQLAKKKPALFLQPMSKWHLYSEFKEGVNTGGAIQNVKLFGIIGSFVLLLACINFMNLSTARSEKRAKEVGIRKTIGSLRSQLVFQFFSESIITVVFAFLLSLILVQLSLSFFNLIADKQLNILWTNPTFWLLCSGFVLFTALIAGSYPAFYLSSFRPVKVLKGTFKAGRFAAIPRKTLVVLQFTVSVTLIIGTIIVYQQIQFAKNRPVGYTRENLITIPEMNEAIHDHFNAVKDELIKANAITSITESGSPTTGVYSSTSGLSWPGKDPNLSTDFKVVECGYDYGKTVDWKLLDGRDFSKDFATDSTALIVNEAAAHYMGLKNIVGENLTWFGTPYRVVGVVKNMVMESPYTEAIPVIYSLSLGSGSVLILKINPAISAKSAISKIESIFKKFNPEQPFEYQFVDEDYARKFSNEVRVGKLAGFFSLLAIIISCLGLFGLTSFVAEQRKKEIGVRKVLGASVLNVWNLLSKDFVFLVVISFVIAVPLSYYFMYQWLQHYEYRTSVAWWVFAVTGAGAMFIALVTVSFQAIKAAIANPVKSLRSE